MHKGVCVGGPLAGRTIETRSQVGFLAVDRPASAAWLYRIDDSGRYVLDTSDDPTLIDDEGTRALDPGRAETALLEKCLDVIALPGDEQEEPGEQIPDGELADDDAEGQG